MTDILHRITIEASPEALYRALTEQNGLSAWWTKTEIPVTGYPLEIPVTGYPLIFKKVCCHLIFG
jgi:uncharacterized protein YndB with AHSA1/START domain